MKILLPVDGSEAALAAVRHVLHLFERGLRAEIVLANVQQPASLYEVVVAHDAQVIEAVSAAAAADALAPAQALLRAAHVAFESEIAPGDPGHALLEIAERFECDAIVIGVRGARLGSVANAVLHRASVPVTVVRAPEISGA